MGQTNSSPDTVAEYFRKATKKLVSLVMPSNSSKALKVVEPFHYFVKISDAGKSPLTIAKARFIYCWEWVDNGKKWINKGLFMTDQDGILFNIPDYINRCKGVDGFNLKAQKYSLKPLDEQTISRLFKDPKEAHLISSYFKVVSTKPSQVIFLRTSEYLFSFCPPEIVDPNTLPGTVPEPTDGGGKHDLLCNEKSEPQFVDKSDPAPADKTATGAPAQQTVTQLVDDRLIFWNIPCSYWFSSVDNIKKFAYFMPRSWWPPQKGTPEEIITTEQWKTHYLPEKEFNTAVLSMPVTLEEEVSRLGWDAHFLDLQYTKYIEQSQSYLEACSNIEEINFWLNLSAECPGFAYEKELRKLPNSTYQGESDRAGQLYESAIRKRVKIDCVPVTKLADRVAQYRKNLESYASSPQNKAFVNAHTIIQKAKTLLKNRIKEKSLHSRITDWYAFLKSYAKGQPYPYSMKSLPLFIDDVNLLKAVSTGLSSNSSGIDKVKQQELKKNIRYELVLYHVVYQAFAMLLGCRAGADSGIPSTETLEAEYISTVLEEFPELEKILLNTYIKNEKKKAGEESITSAFFNLLQKEYKNAGVVQSRPLSAEELREPVGELPVEKKTLLGVLFEEVTTKVIPGLWDNQAGYDSIIAVIWKMGVSARCTTALSSSNFGFELRFLTNMFRAQIGLLILSRGKNLRWTELEVGLRTSIKAVLRPVTGKYESNPYKILDNIKSTIKGTNGIGEAPGIISAMTSCVGAIIAVKGFADTWYKGKPKQFQFKATELIDLAIQVQGVGLYMSGITLGTFKYVSGLNELYNGLIKSANGIIGNVNNVFQNAGKLCSKFNGFVNLYQAYQYSQQAMYFESTGENLYRNLHFISAASYALAGISSIVSLVLGSAAVFAFVSGVFVIIPIVIGITYAYLKSIEPGMKKLYAHFINKINQIELFHGGEWQYYHIPIAIDTKRSLVQRIEDLLDNEIEEVESMYCHKCSVHSKDEWHSILEQINSEIKPFHNVCIIHAGAALTLRGYPEEVIVLAAKEKDEKIRSDERKFINKCIESSENKDIISMCKQHIGENDHEEYAKGQIPNI